MSTIRTLAWSAAGLVLAILSACSTEATRPAVGTPAYTIVLERTEFPVIVTGEAELRSARETTIHCGVEGRTTVIFLHAEGSLAAAGDVLVELDASGLRQRRAEQAIALARAEAALARAANEAEGAALEAEREIRAERVEHLDAQIERAVVRAPIPGLVVHARGIREGAVVRERQPLLHLTDLGAMQARVPLRARDRARVAVGQPATVHADVLPDSELEGKVADVTPEQVVVNLERAEETSELRPFMSASVAIEVERLQDVFAVPARCVRTEEGTPLVWRQTEDGGAEAVVVDVAAGDGERFALRGDLAVGDRLLLSPPGNRQR